MKRLLFPVVAVLVAAPLAAQEVPLDTARTHVVRPGDTLWELSRRYLSDPFRWQEIFGVNRDVVADPHWIYPAERLRIPGSIVSIAAVASAPANEYLGGSAASVPARTVFFPRNDAPAAGMLITAADAEEVTVVTRGDFYRAGVLVPDARMQPVGSLVEVAEATVVEMRGPRQIHPHTRVYMKLDPAASGGVRVGDELHLWRPGREIRPYGRVYNSTGVARVVAVDGEVATVEVERFFAAVLPGDLALPMEQFDVPGGVIPHPASGMEGRIVAFASTRAVPSVEDVAYIDLGESSGVAEGDEFAVVIPRQAAEYGLRPELEVARLQVVRVTDRTAAARVIHLEQPALEAGLQVRLVGKMP